jgi:hypothetical protein
MKMAALFTPLKRIEYRSAYFLIIGTFFRGTQTILKMLAFSVAERNNILHSLCGKSVLGDKKWLYGLMRRHKKILS